MPQGWPLALAHTKVDRRTARRAPLRRHALCAVLMWRTPGHERSCLAKCDSSTVTVSVHQVFNALISTSGLHNASQPQSSKSAQMLTRQAGLLVRDRECTLAPGAGRASSHDELWLCIGACLSPAWDVQKRPTILLLAPFQTPRWACCAGLLPPPRSETVPIDTGIVPR